MSYNQYLDPQQKVRCTECGLMSDSCQCEFPGEMSHWRLFSHEGQMARAILDTVIEDQYKAPDTRYLTTRLVVAVAEMLDDFRKLQLNNEEGHIPEAQILRRGIRVGALAVRLVCQQQPGVSYRPEIAFGED